MSKMMKAVQVFATGGVEALTFNNNAIVPIITPSQILVQNMFVGVNFIDTYHRTGLYKLPLPFVPGREGSGIVVEVGADVKAFKVGDRVAYTGTATYAEYTAVNTDFTVKLPDSMTHETGAALLLQGLTAISLAKMAYTIKAGDYVLIHACAGGTGSLLVQLCKYYGAFVIGSTSSAEKKELAIKSGADHVLLYTSQNIHEEVMRITNGKGNTPLTIGVQAVFDGVGKSTFDTSLVCLAKFGTMLSFGNASGKVEPIDIMKLVPRAIKLMRPSLFEIAKTREDFERMSAELMKLVQDGHMKFHIHEIYPLVQAGRAHEDLEGRGTTGKLVLAI